MSSSLHPASLVDAALHSAATLQLVDLALTGHLIGKCLGQVPPFVFLTLVRLIRLCRAVHCRSCRLCTWSRRFPQELKSQRRLPSRRVHGIRVQRALSV